uniref:ATP-dependent RNA helicase n=1 Tax=Macrostomum lignano TaxID=282301 RepID=A0A1I8HIY2_9PLAT
IFQEIDEPNASPEASIDEAKPSADGLDNGEAQQASVGGFTLVPDRTRKRRRAPLGVGSAGSAYRPEWMRRPVAIDNSLDASVPIDSIDCLSEPIRSALRSTGVETLFPVQATSVPLVLASHRYSWTRPRDFAVCAATGSGKTLAYLLPALQLLAACKTVALRCIIVLPVRDLAMQVHQVCLRLLAALSEGAADSDGCRRQIRCQLLVGERSLEKERHQLVRLMPDGSYRPLADLVICTPGRLADHLLNCPGLSLARLRMLIIDEADRVMAEQKQDWFGLLERLLDRPMPHPSIHSWLHSKPPHLQKLLLSATLTHNPELLQRFRLHNPLLLTATAESDKELEVSAAPGRLSEFFVQLKPSQKPLFVIHLVLGLGRSRVLCFTNSRESAHRLASLITHFADPRVTCEAVSARLPVPKRARILRRFSTGQLSVLVCSDSMARGMDLPSVDAVVCYDRPASLRTYVHRAGRTARAGRAGAAYTLLERREVLHFRRMLSAGGRQVREVRLHGSKTKRYEARYQTALNRLHEEQKAGEAASEDPSKDQNKKTSMKKRKTKEDKSKEATNPQSGMSADEAAEPMEEELKEELPKSSTGKSLKPGIVYLSSVPHGMTVKLVREHLSPYGKLGRVFLQVDEASARKRWRLYSEGWAEFLRRSDAKRCVASLNATEVADKKKPWAGQLWNLRYLPGFAWTDITYREANEKAVRNKRLAMEIQQARRIGKLYKESLEQSKYQERAKQAKGDQFRPLPELQRVEQRRRRERRSRKGNNDPELQAVNNPTFLAQLLGGGRGKS